jgi:hypothetical protein
VDTKKWKSVLVPIEVYSDIKAEAKLQGRTISGQLRYMHDVYTIAADNGDIIEIADVVRGGRVH